jgi:hypothetical protein
MTNRPSTCIVCGKPATLLNVLPFSHNEAEHADRERYEGVTVNLCAIKCLGYVSATLRTLHERN